MDSFIKIAGTGSYLPGKPVEFSKINDILGRITDAPVKIQKWLDRIETLMSEMLDIDYYHYALDPVTKEYSDDNITMSVKAAQSALVMSNMRADEIELITYGSAHQDQMPTASVRIQEALGIEQCGELSIHSNCTSAYKALLLAGDLINNGRYNNALVLSSSISSSELRADYYNQKLIKKEDVFLRWFLCDGAGALILKKVDKKDEGLYLENCYMESVGGKKPSVMNNKRPAYWMNPKEEYEKGFHHLSQMFQEQLRAYFHDEDGTVFYKGLKRMIEKYKIDLTKLKYFQVNLPSKHISDLVMEECESLGINRSTLYTKMSKYGYSGPPAVFITLDKILREEKLENEDLIMSFVTEVSKFMQAGFNMKYFSSKGSRA
ncbi:MAG: 3-oxoacyl-ACP synthase [Spirochaetes bacterium]|nr:3-oxoacyl-ACP synthase [Spirochaetota bacterium]